MKIYRCRICGDTHLGSEAPSHCPFCGAHRELFVETTEYPEDINDIQITEAERDDITAAIELERSNSRFYIALASHDDNKKLASAYKRLAKIEAEHASVFSKLAKTPKPSDLLDAADAPRDWCANIADSAAREQRASAFYAVVADRATNERVREVFSAISAVEADHIAVDEVAKGIAGC